MQLIVTFKWTVFTFAVLLFNVKVKKQIQGQ